MRAWSHRRRVERARFDYGAPIAKIDTRPMVFVAMFVAVIFLLAASQMKTHAVVFYLPDTPSNEYYEGSWPDQGVPLHTRPLGNPGIAVNILEVTADDRILWNGEAVSEPVLTQLFYDVQSVTPEPELHFRPDALASYETSARILAIANQSGIQKLVVPGLDEHCAIGKQWAAKPPDARYAIALSIVLPDKPSPTLEHSGICPPSP